MKSLILCICLFLSVVSVFAKQDVQREYYEWSQIWRAGSNATDKPHVLLIGDSICNAYRDGVQESLKDLCYIDKLATSRSIDQDYYWKQIDMVLSDENYNLIIFNFGLHNHISGKEYYKYMDKLAKTLIKTGAKVVCLGTTPLYYEGDENKTKETNKSYVYEMNIHAKLVAKKNKIDFIDWCDMWLKPEYRAKNDAYHYNSLGVSEQAKFISDKIKEYLK